MKVLNPFLVVTGMILISLIDLIFFLKLFALIFLFIIMYHQKNGAKVRVFSEMANEITVFFPAER